jgi:uncharacterized protein YndB with AHSA1/START domain
MNTLLQTSYKKDVANKKIIVTRAFNAPLEMVWKAWTDKTILDQWWAPKPWKAETKEMNFAAGGHWLYAMKGPDGEKHYSRADYTAVTPMQSFVGVDNFCDENGKKSDVMGSSTWKVNFETAGDAIKVTVEMTFETVEDLNKIVEMGFEQGFAMAHTNLDEILKAGK